MAIMVLSSERRMHGYLHDTGLQNTTDIEINGDILCDFAQIRQSPENNGSPPHSVKTLKPIQLSTMPPTKHETLITLYKTPKISAGKSHRIALVMYFVHEALLLYNPPKASSLSTGIYYIGANLIQRRKYWRCRGLRVKCGC